MSMIVPTDEQNNVVAMSKIHRALKISAYAGAAKAQPVWSKVKTPDGDRMIGEMSVGDPIFRRDGTVGKVIGVFPQGVKHTYRVTFRDGSETHCNEEHLWTVKRGTYPKKGWVTKTLREIIDDGLYNNAGAMRYAIPLCEPVQYESVNHFIHPYVLGFLIGDGHLSGGTPAVSFGEKDVESLSIVDSFLPDGFRLNARYTSENCQQATITEVVKSVHNSTNPFMTELKRLCLNVKSGGKFIPQEYMKDSVENRIWLLKGLMDSDGSCSKNRTRFSTTSYELAKDVVTLTQSLGGTCIVNHTDNRDGRLNPIYYLNVKMFVNPFEVKSKASLWSFSEKNPPSRYIKKVEQIGQDEHVCIKVDADDSLYLTDEFIVTHNTSTLCMVAAEHVVPSLMLTFNKSLADEAKSRFPSWCECRTTHSLAYASFGAMLQKKLKRPSGPYRNVAGTGTEIAKYFKTGDFIYLVEGEREARKMKAGGVGVAIKETVAKFEQSADEKIGYRHVSTTTCDQVLLRDAKSLQSFKYLVLSCAQKLWQLRIDVRSDVLATHDTYLKLYQLSHPDLSQYEVLYLDECQDVNAVVLDIFLRQQDKCRLYAVGDGYQNIYSWRGAMNAMLSLDWPEARLSKSFRFGQEIGDLADVVLAMDGVKQTQVKGWEKLSTYCVPKEDLSEEVWNGQYTMLFRTNGALIFQAVDLISQGKKVNLEIDVSDFTKFLDSAISLSNSEMNKVKHEKLVQFENWLECVTEADAVKGELGRVVSMVNNGSVYTVLKFLADHKNHSNPDVILTTAHKSKGREWDTVILADDFPSVFNEKGEWVGLQDSERNLLYVALTRVKKTLGYNETVKNLIERSENVRRYKIS